MGVTSLEPGTGELCWEEPFTGPGRITIADAVQSGSYLLVSGFYTGSTMLRLNLDRPAATALWTGRTSRVLEDGVEVAEASTRDWMACPAQRGASRSTCGSRSGTPSTR